MVLQKYIALQFQHLQDILVVTQTYLENDPHPLHDYM